MKDRFWKINKEKLNKTNIALYSSFIRKKYKTNLSNDFNSLWKWSIDNNEIFLTGKLIINTLNINDFYKSFQIHLNCFLFLPFV